MNDRQIECFLEAARLLNFTRAAEHMRLPQPAVSRYISSLEEDLGAQLFLRESNRKVLLTEAGKAYYNLFQRTALELEHTRRSLADDTESFHLGINLGWHTADYLPQVIALCKQKNPNFHITYECLEFHKLVGALREKQLDAVIALENYLLHSREFEIERFTSIRRTIAYSKHLPNYEAIQNPADFYPYDFLIVDDPMIHKLVYESEDVFRAFHFVPRFRTLPNQETVYSYVENGLGVALLDHWCYILHHPLLLHLDIDESFPVAIAWRRNSAGAVELFRDSLRAVFHDREPK